MVCFAQTTESTLIENIRMDIVQANLDRFKLLLETETDATKRLMIFRLMAEEKAKQVSEAKAKGA